MLGASVLLLGLSVALGGWLGEPYIYPAAPGAKRPGGPGWVAALHGGLATAGLLTLLAWLRLAGPSAWAVKSGAGGFGAAAAFSLGAAWILGSVMLLRGLMRRRVPGLVVALHALLAVTGATLLLALAGLQR